MRMVEVLHELAGNFFDLIRKNKRIRKNIAALGNQQNPARTDDGASLPSADAMFRYLDQEAARRRIIEDKAKTNALAITLALSAMLAGIALVGSLPGSSNNLLDKLVLIVMLLQFLGISFLLIGGLLALRALGVVPTQMWTLEDDKRGFNEEAMKLEIAGYLEYNQHYTTIKSNYVDTSYNCIRNGVISLAMAALVAVIITLAPISRGPC